MTTHRNLVRELKSLRKGRAVLTPRIERKVGPALRTACGITKDDGPAVLRRKLITRLTELTAQLPRDLALAAQAAFALLPETHLPLYGDRVLWAAAQVERDARTVRRRVDEAVEQLAELSAATTSGGDWRMEQLSIAVVLDSERFEVIEQRQVVAEQALAELEFAAPFPARCPDVDAELLYGGTLRRRTTGATDPPRFTLTLVESLSRGQSHRFAVRFRSARRDGVQAGLVYAPERPCDLLDLHVRFGPDQRPSHVRALDGVPRRGFESHGMKQQVNSAGEVHLMFRRLVPGLVYGARWELGPQLLCTALRGSYQASPAGSPAMFHAHETVGVMRL